MPEPRTEYITRGTPISRRDCLILTCESWMSQGAYIAFPINPSQLSFDIGVRTSNEMTRANQLIYIWRFLGNQSALVKPTLKITANSGYIVPSFDPSVIHDCQRLVVERTMSVNAARPQVRDLDITDRALQREYEKLVQGAASNSRNYEAALQNYISARPSFEQTQDYISKVSEYSSIGASLAPSAG